MTLIPWPYRLFAARLVRKYRGTEPELGRMLDHLRAGDVVTVTRRPTRAKKVLARPRIT
jgi:DNA invertase Pin-like site-specific DNA recombinase